MSHSGGFEVILRVILYVVVGLYVGVFVGGGELGGGGASYSAILVLPPPLSLKFSKCSPGRH